MMLLLVSDDRDCVRLSLFREIVFSLSSSISPPHPSCQRVALNRVVAGHRRRSYRRGKLSETGSRTYRLRGSMLLPNSTESGTESAEVRDGHPPLFSPMINTERNCIPGKNRPDILFTIMKVHFPPLLTLLYIFLRFVAVVPGSNVIYARLPMNKLQFVIRRTSLHVCKSTECSDTLSILFCGNFHSCSLAF